MTAAQDCMSENWESIPKQGLERGLNISLERECVVWREGRSAGISERGLDRRCARLHPADIGSLGLIEVPALGRIRISA